MASFNRVILMGNLTRDIELKYTPSGTAVTDIGLAVNDRRKNQNDEWVEETTFVDVTLWARTAEVASEYLSKGSPIFIEGRLKLDTWETDGQKRSKLRVVGERMQISRATVGRILESARHKVAEALVHGKALRIGGGVTTQPLEVDPTRRARRPGVKGQGRGRRRRNLR